MDERGARELVLVQAFDAAQTPQWTPEDRDWASRLAAQTAAADATPEQLLAERAHHALQRLVPRDAGVRRWIARSPWRWRWLFAALIGGVLAGALADLLGREAYINLLAPPVWAVVAWNLVIYVLLGVQALGGPARAAGPARCALARVWQRSGGHGPLQQAMRRWAEISGALTLARASLLLHLGAAALAGGMIAALYLRGLVFDYRVGWQSTFLEPAAVQALLVGGLAPAAALTGIPLPDLNTVAAMRLTPTAPLATAPAAPWLHLYAATLLLAVVLPRLALAALAAGRAWSRGRHIELAVHADPALMALRRYRRHAPMRVLVLPYAAAPAAQAALGLRALLAEIHGPDVQLQFGPTIAVGDEEAAAARSGNGEPALQVVLVELGSTPEAEAHGRLARALRARPTLWVVDESHFAGRFATLPARIEERRAAWRDWAAREGQRCLCVDLGAPISAAAQAAIDAMFSA